MIVKMLDDGFPTVKPVVTEIYIVVEGPMPVSTCSCHILPPHIPLYYAEHRFQIYISQPQVSEPYKVVAKLTVCLGTATRAY